jgi:hypothetical protein
MADNLTAYLEGKTAKGFEPRPVYSPDGDFLTFYFRNDEAYAERVDEVLTVYRAIESRELVGCKIKGVRRLVENLRNFGVSIAPDDGSIRLNLLVLSAASVIPPHGMRHYYEEMGRFTRDVSLDARELQPA